MLKKFEWLEELNNELCRFPEEGSEKYYNMFFPVNQELFKNLSGRDVQLLKREEFSIEKLIVIESLWDQYCEEQKIKLAAENFK